jgi:hypothetical protein
MLVLMILGGQTDNSYLIKLGFNTRSLSVVVWHNIVVCYSVQHLGSSFFIRFTWSQNLA